MQLANIPVHIFLFITSIIESKFIQIHYLETSKCKTFRYISMLFVTIEVTFVKVFSVKILNVPYLIIIDLFIEGSLISAQALFSLRALFGATRIHSFYTRMASLIRTRQSDVYPTRSRHFRRGISISREE